MGRRDVWVVERSFGSAVGICEARISFDRFKIHCPNLHYPSQHPDVPEARKVLEVQ
jgi:hypothetical protein